MSSQSHSQPNIILNNLSEDKVYKAPSLKLETAPGPDQIQPEHIFYGGATLVTHMTALFNQIVEQEYIPQIFQHCLIIRILKASDKDPSDPSNYCGITLVSLTAKYLRMSSFSAFKQLLSPTKFIHSKELSILV